MCLTLKRSPFWEVPQREMAQKKTMIRVRPSFRNVDFIKFASQTESLVKSKMYPKSTPDFEKQTGDPTWNSRPVGRAHASGSLKTLDLPAVPLVKQPVDRKPGNARGGKGGGRGARPKK